MIIANFVKPFGIKYYDFASPLVVEAMTSTINESYRLLRKCLQASPHASGTIWHPFLSKQ